jgi:hypothetical protein
MTIELMQSNESDPGAKLFGATTLKGKVRPFHSHCADCPNIVRLSTTSTRSLEKPYLASETIFSPISSFSALAPSRSGCNLSCVWPI